MLLQHPITHSMFPFHLPLQNSNQKAIQNAYKLCNAFFKNPPAGPFGRSAGLQPAYGPVSNVELMDSLCFKPS
jgi:hypothetical protein